MTPEAGDERSDRPATERAEELADRMGQRFGRVAGQVGLRLRRMTALAGEEAEDVWAEAQSIRRRDPSMVQERGALRTEGNQLRAASGAPTGASGPQAPLSGASPSWWGQLRRRFAGEGGGHDG